MSNVKVDKIPLAESRRVSWLGSTSMSKVTASKIFKTRAPFYEIKRGSK